MQMFWLCTCMGILFVGEFISKTHKQLVLLEKKIIFNMDEI